MIDIILSKTKMDDITRRLKEVGSPSKLTLKEALNETAIQAREMLSEKAREKYAIRKPGFRQAMKLKRATQADLAAVLQSSGEPEPLSEFRVTPNQHSRGDNGPERIRAKVKKGSNLQELIAPGTSPPIKAFITKFKSGHVAVVERVPKGEAPGDSKLGNRFVRELTTVSVPRMIGNDESLREIRPRVIQMLEEAIDAHIAQVMGGKTR